MSRETDIAWCAGFFDGEGCARCSWSRPNERTGRISPILSVSVPQAASNVEVLEFFQSVVEMGKIRGPYPMPNGKPQYVLSFKTREIPRLFEVLKPYLRAQKTADFKRAIHRYENHDELTLDSKEDIIGDDGTADLDVIMRLLKEKGLL